MYGWCCCALSTHHLLGLDSTSISGQHEADALYIMNSLFTKHKPCINLQNDSGMAAIVLISKLTFPRWMPSYHHCELMMPVASGMRKGETPSGPQSLLLAQACSFAWLPMTLPTLTRHKRILEPLVSRSMRHTIGCDSLERRGLSHRFGIASASTSLAMSVLLYARRRM